MRLRELGPDDDEQGQELDRPVTALDGLMTAPTPTILDYF